MNNELTVLLLTFVPLIEVERSGNLEDYKKAIEKMLSLPKYENDEKLKHKYDVFMTNYYNKGPK